MGLRGPKPKRREVHWSPNLAYAVGLMVTDGSLSRDGRHFDFTSKDKEQIQTLMRCFKLTGLKIAKKMAGLPHHGWAYRVQWGDVVLYRFMLSIGLMANKTKLLSSIKIPDAYYVDFLRGHYDGDGSFYSYYDPRWRSSFMFYLTFVSASQAHIDWLRATTERLLGVRGHVTKGRETSLIQLKYAKAETLVILRAMYRTSNSPHLKRKRLKIEKALRIVGQSLPKGG